MSSGRHSFEIALKRLDGGGWRWCISYGTEGDCTDLECGFARTLADGKKAAAAVKRQFDNAFRERGWRGVLAVVANRNQLGHWRSRLHRRSGVEGLKG